MATQLSLFDAIEIPLTQGYVALVDAVDADLAEHKWSCALPNKAHNSAYAIRNVRKKRERLHRVIFSRILGRSLKADEIVDHIDGNGLNNRRSNLRLASKFENAQNIKRRKDNKSGYKGVYWRQWRKNSGAWFSIITSQHRRLWLGYFKSPEEAYEAYCKAARELHGQFANFGRVSNDHK